MMAATADIEAQRSIARPKRLNAFLLLGIISLAWLLAMICVMRYVHQPPSHGKVEEAVDFAGGDIDSAYGVDSMIECRTRCEMHARCIAFTYVKKERACWLKGPAGSRRTSNPNTISGQVNSTLAEARRRNFNGSIDEEWKYKDERLVDEGESYGDMHARELGAASDEGDDERQFLEQGDAYPMHETTEEERLKYNDSMDFFGDISIVMHVHTPADCEIICLEEAKCVAWTLDKARFLCLSRLVNVSVVSDNAVAIGGRISADQVASRHVDEQLPVAQEEPLALQSQGESAPPVAAATAALSKSSNASVHDKPAQTSPVLVLGVSSAGARRSANTTSRVGVARKRATQPKPDRHRRTKTKQHKVDDEDEDDEADDDDDDDGDDDDHDGVNKAKG